MVAMGGRGTDAADQRPELNPGVCYAPNPATSAREADAYKLRVISQLGQGVRCTPYI